MLGITFVFVCDARNSFISQTGLVTNLSFFAGHVDLQVLQFSVSTAFVLYIQVRLKMKNIQVANVSLPVHQVLSLRPKCK